MGWLPARLHAVDAEPLRFGLTRSTAVGHAIGEPAAFAEEGWAGRRLAGLPLGIPCVAVLCLSGLPPSRQTAAGWMRASERIGTIAPTRAVFRRSARRALPDLTLTVSRAAVIIIGPQRGLIVATKAHVPIFVFSSGQGRLDRDVADALRGSPHRADFQIAGSRNDAALLVDVSIEAIDESAMDTSGEFVA
jgi:hypothetical protein